MLPEWAVPVRGRHGNESWSIADWPGKPKHLAGLPLAIQVLKDRKTLYVKPVMLVLPEGYRRDAHNGVSVAWSKHGGDCATALAWVLENLISF